MQSTHIEDEPRGVEVLPGERLDVRLAGGCACRRRAGRRSARDRRRRAAAAAAVGARRGRRHTHRSTRTSSPWSASRRGPRRAARAVCARCRGPWGGGRAPSRASPACGDARCECVARVRARGRESSSRACVGAHHPYPMSSTLSLSCFSQSLRAGRVPVNICCTTSEKSSVLEARRHWRRGSARLEDTPKNKRDNRIGVEATVRT